MYCHDYVENKVKDTDWTLLTVGNCQRPVLSLGESQHMHKVTNL